MLDAAATRDVGRWQIPLRVDGQPVLLTGTFRWEPLPRGGYAARLTSPAEIAPGVLVRLLPGRTPGVLVKSSNRLPLTILDGAGEPFLRIGPDGVDANVRSIAWRRSGRRVIDASDPELKQPAMPRWQRVARTPSFSWIDPRVVDRAEETPGASDSGGRPTMPPVAWHIPVMLGEEPLQIAGSSTWQATVRGTDDARPAKRAASR